MDAAGPEMIVSIKYWPQAQIDFWFNIQHQVQVLMLVTISAMAVIGWEHIQHFPAELRTWKLLLQGKILPARLAVLLVRYACAASMAVTMIFFFSDVRPSMCQPIFTAIYALYVVIWAAAASIFLMRLAILYNGDRIVMAAYYVLWLCCGGVWIYTVTGLKGNPVPYAARTPWAPVCSPDRFPRWGAAAWGASVLFDACVLLGTWLRLARLGSAKGSVARSARSRRWLWASNLAYFGASTCFNLGCLITELSVSSVVYTHLMSPIAFAVHTIIASRLVLASKGWAHGGVNDEDDLMGAGDPGVNSFHARKKRRGTATGLDAISYTIDETVVMSPALTGDGSFMESQQRSRMRRSPPSSDRLYGLGRHDLNSDEGHELELGHVPSGAERGHYAADDDDIEQQQASSRDASPRHTRRLSRMDFDSEPNLSPYLPRFPRAVARRESKSNSWTDEKDDEGSRSLDVGGNSFVLEKPAAEIETPPEETQAIAAPAPHPTLSEARSSTTLGSDSVEILRAGDAPPLR